MLQNRPQQAIVQRVLKKSNDMKFGVVVFPGSSSEDDSYYVLKELCGQRVEKIWHKDEIIDGYTTEDCIILAGGFSFGDYMRAGAIASVTPVMKAIRQHAEKGGVVVGICNGFQILCEAGLLPGVLLQNLDQKFISGIIQIRTETTNSKLTRNLHQGQVLSLPIAHGHGRYYCDEETLEKLKQNDRILFRYCNLEGKSDEDANLNGSVDHIAGICNETRNVFGIMPHPERASESVIGLTEGLLLFEGLIKTPVNPL